MLATNELRTLSEKKVAKSSKSATTLKLVWPVTKGLRDVRAR